jgi:hypothetical protein
MPPQMKCLDDPPTILKQSMCVNPLSKDTSGKLTLNVSERNQCKEPQCVTLKTVHQLKLKAKAHKPCDSKIARSLNGEIVIERLVTAFDQDGNHRGFHAGDFVWTGAGVQATGRMSGITNAGTHREPAFKPCQKCDEPGVMEGRLCGQIVESQDPALKGCQIVAVYRIKFDPSEKGGQGAVRGVIEGVIVCPCK